MVLFSRLPRYLGRGCKGQGRTLQTELIFKTMVVEPVTMSVGELESDIAGDFLQPGYFQWLIVYQIFLPF